MHHHAHAARVAPPHMRAHHMAPPPHINNGPSVPPPPPGTAVASAASLHVRDHHPRLNQPPAQHHQPAPLQASTQLQKLRQQHQHLNNNNTSKSNYHQPPPQYNHAPHMPSPASQQQQQQPHLAVVPQHQQPRHPSAHHHQQHHPSQPHMPHMNVHVQQQQQQNPQQSKPMAASNVTKGGNNSGNNIIITNNNQHQQQQQQAPLLPPQAQQTHQQHRQPPPAQHQPQPHYYACNSNSKSKYNNINAAMPPKSILQNPNRALKTRLHSSAAVNNIEVSTMAPAVKSVEAVNANNNNNIDSNAETTNGGNAAVTPTDNGSACAAAAGTVHGEDASKEANKENIQESASANSNAEPINNSTNSVHSNNNNANCTLLPNEDSSVPKNSKEKTPMCLVNELARFNKITHQYRLTSEKGPAHCKRFTVTLKLGDEEYSAEGFKIKKAQHLAAAEAVEKTKYKHPVPKVNRRCDEGCSSRANITPTVELNALAMKLGQQTYYLFDPRQIAPPDAIGPPPEAMMPPPYGAPPHPPPALGVGGHMLQTHAPPPHPRMLDPSYMRRNGGYMPPPMPHPAQQRFGHRPYMPKYHPRYPMLAPPLPPPPGVHNGMMAGHHAHPGAGFGLPTTPCKVTLIVGKQKFVGIGRTLQQAKHDAAARALQVLKTQATNQLNEILNHSLEESDSKSPISLVHEIGIKRNMTVHFKVLREEGPAHMKNFITACIVGSIVTEGEGNGKKISKKRAAEKMLDELKKLPPLTPTKSPVKRIKVKTPGKPTMGDAVGGKNVSGGMERRKRAGASIKEKTDADVDGENPITRLIQLQQNRKEKEPVFELIAKNGNENSRRREFIIEVTAQGMVARGTGSSKKLAKRNAAQNLLIAMGLDDSVNNPQSDVEASSKPSGSVAATADSNAVAAIESAALRASAAIVATTSPIVAANMEVPLVSTPAGQVPGILILRQNKKHTTKKVKEMPVKATVDNACRISETVECTKIESSAVTSVAPTTTATAVATDIVSIVQANSNAEEITSSMKSIEQPVGASSIEQPAVASTKSIEQPAAASSTSTETETVVACEPIAAPVAASANTSSTTASTSSSSTSGGVHMKDHLLYLAKLLGFEVNFSDYPKGNHKEFLTIVTLSTNPPQICHGVGTSSEESQNDAAKNALKILSELGLNSATK